MTLFRIGNIFYIIELMLGATIFLYPAEKKPQYIWRYLGVAVFLAVFAWYFPSTMEFFGGGSFFIIRSVCQLGLVIVGMGLIYKLPVDARLSSCVAGYAVQHTAYNITTLVSYTSFLKDVAGNGLERHMLLELILFPLIYLGFLLTLGRYAAKNEGYKKADIRFILLSFVTVFVCTGIRRVSAYYDETDTITACLYSITCCALALMVQFVLFRTVALQHENDAINLLWQEERKHYAISKSNMELLNIKYHDLKHTISALDGESSGAEIEAMKEMLRIYDGGIKTGNEALDVLLMENNLRIGKEGIVLNYTGNGTDLSFMNVIDVYTLFGNAVDNAVEAVRKLPEAEKKIVNIVLERKGDMVIVNISNFFDGNIVFQGDVPETSKRENPGYHGFGMKSMKLIAEKYNGALHAKVNGDIFNLSIYLMKG